MKPKTLLGLVLGLAATVTLSNLTIGGFENPLGPGEQIFNVSQRIEQDDWAKAAVTMVRKNHFASSQVINVGFRGEVGIEIEAVIADIYGLSQPDATQPFLELSGNDAAEKIKSQANWKGTTLCRGEGVSKCDIYMAWPQSAEKQENVVLVGVHLDKAVWALVEKSLLEDLVVQQ